MFQGDYTISISLITENYWADIVKIQKEAYNDIAPEDLNILKNKWHSSPQTCAVYLNHKGKAIAYLLAHPWASEITPKLNEKISVTHSSTLFIHDLALVLEGRGKNIAKALVQNLIENAQVQSFLKIQLVAVQNSTEFWAKFGFINMPLVKKFAQVMVKTHN
ncbi:MULTISPECIES: GNAT family N-acetyltransferase [unclassified Pseudoalteromonas]|uniref:GNAT family N-acetyltransferase n=1 Tax=unclassified Pseudoalteromonas TaxID=194690 RepID=UPI0006931E3A|nr:MULTISPECIES: GNAT family N-acetyltransferase [unclassified Pseudoalteromonas]